MKKQKGYAEGTFTGLVIVCIILGIVIAYGVPWLWGLIKPIIHALTA